MEKNSSALALINAKGGHLEADLVKKEEPSGGDASVLLPSAGGKVEQLCNPGRPAADDQKGDDKKVVGSGGDGAQVPWVDHGHVVPENADHDKKATTSDQITPTKRKRVGGDGNEGSNQRVKERRVLEERAYACPWKTCPEVYGSRSALFEHTRVHSRRPWGRDIPPPPPPPPPQVSRDQKGKGEAKMEDEDEKGTKGKAKAEEEEKGKGKAKAVVEEEKDKGKAGNKIMVKVKVKVEVEEKEKEVKVILPPPPGYKAAAAFATSTGGGTAGAPKNSGRAADFDLNSKPFLLPDLNLPPPQSWLEE